MCQLPVRHLTTVVLNKKAIMGFKNIAALLLLASTTALAQVTDPVLMRVNGKEVTRSEFEYAFNKNNNNLAGEGQSVEEY